MDEITYDNVVDLEEFKNKKRINTPVYKLIRECEAVLEKEIQDRVEICNKKFEDLGVTGVSFQKINFNPHNGLPVTTLLTYEDVFGELPGSDDYLPPAC